MNIFCVPVLPIHIFQCELCSRLRSIMSIMKNVANDSLGIYCNQIQNNSLGDYRLLYDDEPSNWT